MMLIEESWDLKGLYADGILGMSPSAQRGKADLVVQKLYEQGSIPQNVFSFQVGALDEKSVVTIGGYNVEKFAKENETLVWHNLTNKFWWTLGLEGVQLDGEDLHIKTNKVIIDTGTSFTLVPKRDFRYIMNYFQNRGHECKFDKNMYNLYVC
jgi:cathepsin D